MNPGGSPQSVERDEQTVWIESFRAHAYIRLGPKHNLATVNDPRMAEVVREALQRHVDGAASAKGNEKPISEEKT